MLIHISMTNTITSFISVTHHHICLFCRNELWFLFLSTIGYNILCCTLSFVICQYYRLKRTEQTDERWSYSAVRVLIKFALHLSTVQTFAHRLLLIYLSWYLIQNTVGKEIHEIKNQFHTFFGCYRNLCCSFLVNRCRNNSKFSKNFHRVLATMNNHYHKEDIAPFFKTLKHISPSISLCSTIS